MRRWTWPLAGLVVTLGWAVACVAGPPSDALERAAAASAAALVAAALVPVSLEAVLGAAVLLGVLPLAMTSAPLLAGALLAVAATDAVAAHEFRPERLVAPVGAALVTAGIAVSAVDGFGWHLRPEGRPAAVLILAGALLILAAADRPLPTVLLVPALLAASAAVPLLPALSVAVAAGVAAVALALFGREGPALAALALGPLALGATRPAGLLLLAAGVLAAAAPSRLALLAALPGTVALVNSLADRRLVGAHVAIAVALAATAALLAWRPARSGREPLERRHLPAVALLAWLAVLPDTQRWTGSRRVEVFQRGAAFALAGSALAVLAALAWNARHARPDRPEPQEAA